jgi:hypothetical protein
VHAEAARLSADLVRVHQSRRAAESLLREAEARLGEAEGRLLEAKAERNAARAAAAAAAVIARDGVGEQEVGLLLAEQAKEALEQVNGNPLLFTSGPV